MTKAWSASTLRSRRHPVPRKAGPRTYQYHDQPWLVYWEITRACGLACRHCRAEAMPRRHPLELTEREAEAFVDSLTGFGPRPPHLVITGGDPLCRPDMFALVDRAIARGIGVSLAPSVTDLLTRDVIRRLAEAGVTTVSLSLDGPDAASHDGIRGVPGCFDRTLDMARVIVEEGIDLQINTLVTAGTAPALPEVDALVESLGAMRWSLFFLIGVGRGSVLQSVSPEEAEELMAWITERMRHAPFQIKTTEAPHFRRVFIQKLLAEGRSMADVYALPFARGFGVRDGNGIVFVSHTGEVYPSGFLPVSAGNVREAGIVELYRDSPLFTALRDPDGYEGKCGYCEFRRLCGGSRARAYAETGNVLGSDPLCLYQPKRQSA